VAVEKSTHNSILLNHHKSLQETVATYVSTIKKKLMDIFKEEDLEYNINTTKKPSQNLDTATMPYETYLMAANPQDEFESSNFPSITPQTSKNTPTPPPSIDRNTMQQPIQNIQTEKQKLSAWNKPLHHTPHPISIDQLQQCLRETKETSKLAENQQKELEKTKTLLDSSNKLVFEVAQRVQEMSEQMTMVTQTITGLVQSVNAIARFMNNQNNPIESPQSGQPLLPIIPTPSPPDNHTPNPSSRHTQQSITEPSPHEQEGYPT
jgi:hypothetical protein